MSRRIWVCLLAILAFSAGLRLYRLNSLPVELTGDEIDVGIQANSLYRTGRDYLGHPLPVFLQSFSEYRLPLLHYLTVPFTILGLNEWTVRLPLVVLSLLSILTIFVLGYHFGGPRLSLLATFLATISPWHIQFSRWSNDNLAIVLLSTLGVALFLRRHYMFSALALALSFYSYSVAAVFIPLLVLILRPSPRKLILPAILGLALLVPYASGLSQQLASKRFSQISVFSDSTLRDDLTLRRLQSTSLFARIFRNRLVYYPQEILNNYLKSFSTEFLFFQGDPVLRHSVGGMGMLYTFEIITILTGLFASRNKTLIFWLLIAPLASALTKDGGNHAGRLIVMLPPLLLLSAYGINSLWNKKIIFIFLSAFALFNFSFYLYRYYAEWTTDGWRFWQPGYKTAMAYLKSLDPVLTRVYFNNTYEFTLSRFLFWYAYDPVEFQRQYPLRDTNPIPGFDGFNLGKYYFGTLKNKTAESGFANLLQPGVAYLASVRDEVGTGTVGGVNVDLIISSPTGLSLYYILTQQ
ncbi:glycosyltransferase family 39 protein [Candidatus Amesbacteria bacterium]|nr:glycosyltransferase family 39 protein [Candidatus Amesbacteria bacterium]